MEEGPGMRVRPSVGAGIGLAVAYMAVFGGLFKLSGVGYDDVTASADNMLKAVIIPVGVALLVFIVVTSIFGWWKPVIRDRQRAGGWVTAVPVVMIIAILIGVDYANLGVLDASLVLSIGVGTALVGLSEELMYRGLVIVSFRGSMREGHVWLWSSVAFGLLHSINALLGQSVGATVRQVGFTFLIGSGMYIARRATGWILVPMVIHAAWDFSTFTQGGESSLGGLIQMLTLLLLVVVLVAGRHRLFDTTGESATGAVV
jgi:membrane protease YdiL (CAAX protease family)